MRRENLTQLKSYSKLKEAARVDVPAVMSGESGAERVKGYDIPMGGGLEFNYAARPVNEEILDILQELSDEQELGAKYEALYNGERVNTGENRMVLHQLCRGQLGNDVFDGDVNKREFFVEQQRRVAEFAGKVHGGEYRLINAGILVADLNKRVRLLVEYLLDQRGNVVVMIVKGVAVDTAVLHDLLDSDLVDLLLVEQLHKGSFDSVLSESCHSTPLEKIIYKV